MRVGRKPVTHVPLAHAHTHISCPCLNQWRAAKCNASPFSLVAEHLACNQKVASSILAAGSALCLVCLHVWVGEHKCIGVVDV